MGRKLRGVMAATAAVKNTSHSGSCFSLFLLCSFSFCFVLTGASVYFVRCNIYFLGLFRFLAVVRRMP